MIKFLKNLFNKDVYILDTKNIKNNYPPLLDGKPNEIVLKEKKYNRDSKGRFAKKG